MAVAEYMRLTKETLPWFENFLPEELRKRLAADKFVFAIGAVENGTACAVLVAEIWKEGIANILYLVVAEDFRRKGIASGMVDFFSRYADQQGIPVRCLFSASGQEDPIYTFFVDLPDFYISEEEGYVCRIPLESLTGSQTLMSAEKYEKNPVSFFSLPSQQQKIFYRNLSENGDFYLEDLYSRQKDYCKELSLCSRKGEEIQAAIFVRNEKDGLVLDYIWCAPQKQVVLISLLAQAARIVEDKEMQGWLSIAAVEPQMEKVVEKLFPHREVTKYFYCAAKEIV